MSELLLGDYRVYDDKADFIKRPIYCHRHDGGQLDRASTSQAGRDAAASGSAQSVVVHNGGPGERYADLTIAYPDINFSQDLPALLVTVFDNISMDGRIKLTKLGFSEAFRSAFPERNLASVAYREYLGVYDRPLLMGIFKSVFGLNLDERERAIYPPGSRWR